MSPVTLDRLLIATDNQGKLKEYRALLHGIPYNLVSLAEPGITPVDVEDGTTFEENALLKARTYSQLSGMLTLSDDSGLEVDALGGRPGIHSARYGGESSDEARVRLLLRELEGVPYDKRTARFRCAIVLHAAGEMLAVCRGVCAGMISFEPRGHEGFGYDPVFYMPVMERTMAELSFEEKNRVSHRAKAAEQARQVLLRLSRERS